MKKVRISNRSLAAMVYGIERYPDKENGGLLIGIKRKDMFDIIEAIDAGKNAVHKRGQVTLDSESVEYMANTIKGLYEEEFDVVGIWHKHNHDYNKTEPFSVEDELCHRELCDSLKQDILSILFQKNQDGVYIMRVFRYNIEHQLTEEEFVVEELSKMATYRIWE